MRKQAIERVGVDGVENSLKKLIFLGKSGEFLVFWGLFRGEVVTDDSLEVEERFIIGGGNVGEDLGGEDILSLLFGLRSGRADFCFNVDGLTRG